MKSLLLLLLPAVLGINPEKVCLVNYRIFGGENADRDEFPGLVSVQKNVQVGSNILTGYCAGSLIADRWVITAAHCVVVKPTEHVVSISVHPTKNDPKYIESRDLFIHEQYRRYRNDIALIRLPVPMSTIDTNIKVTPLPLQDQWLTNNEVTLVGWGVTSTTIEEVFPEQLQKLEHIPIDQRLCGRYGYSPLQALCRYPTRATGTTCPGDSGGPIFMDGVQVGIVSHTESRSIFPFLPAPTVQIDTRVSGYRNWIDAKIRFYSS